MQMKKKLHEFWHRVGRGRLVSRRPASMTRFGRSSMWTFVRQLGAIAALPGLVAAVVPLWLAQQNHVVLTARAR